MSKTQGPPLEELVVVAKALDYARQLITVDSDNDIEFEEIERSDDHKYWLVTIGYWQPKPKSLLEKEAEKYKSETRGIILRLPSAELMKVYKVVKVDAATKKPVSMKLREHD